MEVLRYNWVLKQENPNRGRVGYYVTAGKLTEEEAMDLAQKQQSRLVMPIMESQE